jgi:propionyl-CoA synthetase
MVPDAVVAMLAGARIGALHSVVFGGFAAQELAAGTEDARLVTEDPTALDTLRPLLHGG